MADFSERLRQLREQKGVSQQELADVIKVNKMTISGYERGIRRPAGENAREIYERLADYFNVDTSFLMGLSDVTVTLSNPLSQPITDSLKAQLVYHYDRLDDGGKEQLVNIARAMDKSGEYKQIESGEDVG